MKSCSPARRATWALDATSNPRPSMNFLFTEESEQQKKVFQSKKDFWKTVSQNWDWKKKMLGNKFESFQNRDPEDTSTIKTEFFIIRQIIIIPLLKHLGGSRGYRTVKITKVKWKEKQSYPFSRDRRGIKPHPLGSIYQEMLQPVSLYSNLQKKIFLVGWPK